MNHPIKFTNGLSISEANIIKKVQPNISHLNALLVRYASGVISIEMVTYEGED